MSCYAYLASITPVRVAPGFFLGLGGWLLVGCIRVQEA